MKLRPPFFYPVSLWHAYAMRVVLASLMALAISSHAWAALPWATGARQGQAVVNTEHVRAELVVYAPQGVHPGADVWLGLHMEHQPGWHTYWKNPGDTGLPTALIWQLPAGIAVGDIQWPMPKPLPVADTLVNYGYEDTVLLPVQVSTLPDFQNTDLTIKLRADWLACRVECIPEGGDFVLTIPTQQTTLSKLGAFEAAWQAAPQEVDSVSAQVQVNEQPVADAPGSMQWRIQGLPQVMQGKALVLLPENEGIMLNTGPVQSAWDGDVWVATYALNAQRLGSPDRMQAVINLASAQAAGAASTAIRIDAPVSGQWPAKKAVSIPPALQAGMDADRAAAAAHSQPASQTAAGSTSFFGALVLALLGGLLLNLMPCVFPVLSIKALTFAQSGGHTRRMHLATGASYGLGVVLTMLALASVMLALRATGAGLGWGFQLQSPVFVALLAGLFTLISLNLLGVFEVRAILPSNISNLRGQTATLDAFFSGIVSVLIATPCSAPFMGAALGVALMMPTWQALLIFAALGVGLALPLVLIACVPSLARWLPRPGAWMLTFRTLMAFPMLATVLWLVWVIGRQTGVDGAVGLLAILLALAMLVWVLGWRQQALALTSQARAGRWVAVTISALVWAGALVWFAPALRPSSASTSVQAQLPAGWQVWSPERVAQLQAQGHPVFIDFTAAWCVTCQLNKRTTLTQPDVLKAFADQGVTLMQADWTSYDPVITTELQRLGRSGVPVYVLLIPGQAPRLLPEVLTPGMVIEALSDM